MPPIDSISLAISGFPWTSKHPLGWTDPARPASRRRCPPHFGRCADLAADQIGTIVESDQLAGKQGHQPLLQGIVLRVNHHAVGNPLKKVLYMARTYPDGRGRGNKFLPRFESSVGRWPPQFPSCKESPACFSEAGLQRSCQRPQGLGTDRDKRSSASETACLRSSVNFTVEGKVSKPLSRVSQSAFSRAEPGRPQRVTESQVYLSTRR